jgi:uncharacterized membrane protein YjfL (UPF0719 family)
MHISQEWYEILLAVVTIIMYGLYIFAYLGILKVYGEQYIPLLVTLRTLILAGFLLYFYNPFRSSFSYGPALPTFAFTAGISLLLFLKKYDIENLVHFILHGQLLPVPDKKCAT